MPFKCCAVGCPQPDGGGETLRSFPADVDNTIPHWQAPIPHWQARHLETNTIPHWQAPIPHWQARHLETNTIPHWQAPIPHWQARHLETNTIPHWQAPIPHWQARHLETAASYITRHWNYYIRKGIFMTLSSGGILTLTFKKTVGELLFDGYREPLIKIVRAIPFFAYLHLPAWDRFGWLYSRNGSTEFDGVFNMGTGINSTFGNLYSWEYNNRTPFFDGSCASVNGSTGQYFPRNLKKDWITVYTPELRRTSTLKFEKEETVNNILGYKYIAEDYVLDNGTLFPENECFCNGECVPSGTVNISNTRFGVPLFVSLPHFYKADPYYLNSVEGLKPDKDKHEFAMTVEPTTGIVIKINIGVQLSMLVQPNSGTSMFENVPKFFMPVMWTKQTYEINGYLRFLLLLLVNFPRICVTVGSLMIIASVFMLSIVAYRKFRQRMRQKTKTIGFFEERVPLKTELEGKSREFAISK